jgi:hypothetical protein
VQVLLLAFPSADALEVWRAYLQRCSTGGGAAAAAAAGSAGAGVGAESSDFCGWLLKAAPGWKTFQNRFIVLDADKCALRYFEVGPTVSTGNRRPRAAAGAPAARVLRRHALNNPPAPNPRARSPTHPDGGHGAAAGRDHSQGL